jgi:ethanolamine utilization cobalamin adenosyltransferase
MEYIYTLPIKIKHLMQQNKHVSALVLYKSVTIPFAQIQEECNSLIEGMSRKAQRKLLEQRSIKPGEVTECTGILLVLKTSPPLTLVQIYMKRMREILAEQLQNSKQFGKWLGELQAFIVSFVHFFVDVYNSKPSTELERLYTIAYSDIDASERKEVEVEFMKLVL